MAATPAGGLFQPFPRGSSGARMLMLVTALLVTFGTVAVASASEGQAGANGGSSVSIIVRDLVYLGFGVFAFYVVARVQLRHLVRRAPLLVGVGLLLLLAVEGVGVSANGGKRWLNLHVIFLQPSEIYKFVTVIFVAWLVQHHHDELGHWKQFTIWTAPVWIGAGLIVVEPDIGTSSVVLAIAFAMLGVAGLSRTMMLRITALGVVAFLGYMKLKPYSAARFFSFLHPNRDLLGSGYQLLQSKIGLGAGGLTGLGLGQSREKWGLLPNPHTDFIFTIIGEELGFVGALLVIGLFVWFLLVSIHIAKLCTNDVYRLITVGVTTWIMVEAVINIASVVGGWAVTGIPLPFFSYGGTALISELAAVGLVYNIAHDRTRSGDVAIRDFQVTNFRDSLERRAMNHRGPVTQRPRAQRQDR
ncbi:MAG: FtsW/RodA/SpoVE family cell cycle protein [Acidobacteria bacterium]|nr:FtsW/RodA/SpoVE family cell cycle protein [Acidobacteriota bacterium]